MHTLPRDKSPLGALATIQCRYSLLVGIAGEEASAKQPFLGKTQVVSAIVQIAAETEDLTYNLQ